MSTILVTGASGFVGSHLVPAAARGRSSGRGPRPHADAAGATVLGRLPGRARAGVETAGRRRDRPATLGRGAGRRRCGRPPRGHPARPAAAAEPATGSTSRGPRNLIAAAEAGASAVSSTWARWAWSTIHASTTRARRRAAEALVRASGLDWTILKPSLQFGRARRLLQHRSPASSGSRPGIVPVPGNGEAASSRSTSDDVARPSRPGRWSDPATIGGAYELGGPRYWTYREITREVLPALGQRRLIVPDAGRPDLAGRRLGRARPHPVPGRHRPAPPAAARQHRAARRLSRRPSGSRRGRWRAPSATCARSGATRSRAARAGPAGPRPLPARLAAGASSRLGRLPSRSSRSAGGGASCSAWHRPGSSTGMSRVARRGRRPELTGRPTRPSLRA